MNQPTEHPHPRWCTDRQLCSTIGAHTGRPVTVNSRNGDFLSVSLQLAIVPGAQPFVIVLQTEPSSGYPLSRLGPCRSA
jgi:hypothetical protein